jgi:hypothetical protein
MTAPLQLAAPVRPAVMASARPTERWAAPVRVIQGLVAAEFDLPLDAMLSERRTARLARPRQVAIYLASVCTNYSLPQIGRCFRRDHSTVIQAIRVVQKRMASSPELALRVKRLQGELAVMQPTAQLLAEDIVEEFSQLLRSLLRRDPRLLLAELRALAERLEMRP